MLKPWVEGCYFMFAGMEDWRGASLKHTWKSCNRKSSVEGSRLIELLKRTLVWQGALTQWYLAYVISLLHTTTLSTSWEMKVSWEAMHEHLPLIIFCKLFAMWIEYLCWPICKLTVLFDFLWFSVSRAVQIIFWYNFKAMDKDKDDYFEAQQRKFVLFERQKIIY